MKFLLPFFLTLFGCSQSFAGQGVTADYVRLNPSSLPSACRTGDLRFDSVTSQLFFCKAQVWISQGSVGGGGTGLGVLTPNATLVGNGSGAVNLAGPGTSGYLYTSSGASSIPIFSQLNLATSPAITGVLPIVNGGFGLSTIGSSGQVATVSGAAIAWATPIVYQNGTVTSVSGSYPIFSTSGATPILSLSGAVPYTNGGTGLTTVGSSNQVLTVSGGVPVWATPAAGGGTGTVTSVSGSYPIFSTSGATPTLSLSGAVPYPNGGTGLTTLGSSGQVLTVSGAAIAWATPTAGTGSVTSVSGSYPINSTSGATPVLSLSGAVSTANGGTGLTTVGSSNQVLTISGSAPAWVSPTIYGTGTVTSVSGSYPINSTSGATPVLSLSGAVPIANGGTNSITALLGKQMMLSSGGQIVEGGALTNGQIFIGTSGALPVPANITAGANITVTNTSGGISIASIAGGTGTVVSVSGSYPIFSTSGANPVISLSGTIPTANIPSLSGTYYQLNGNAFGAQAVIGTTDNNSVAILANNATQMTVLQSGQVGIGTAAPTHALTFVSGSTGLAEYNTGDQTVNYERATLKWTGSAFLLGTEFGGSGLSRAFKMGAATSAGSNITSGKTLNIQGVSPFFVFNASTGQNGNIADFSSTTISSSNGRQSALAINPIVTSTVSGSTTVFLINPTLTTLGNSGANLLLDAQANSVSKFSVNTSGMVALGNITPLTALDVSGALNMRGMAAPALSSTGQGTIYFDKTSGAYYVSQSGAAYVNLVGMTNPMTSSGDIIIGNSSGTPARLAIGSTNQILSVSGGVPIWTTSNAGGYTAPSVTVLTSGSSQTYTTPSGCLYLKVTGVAGGGGGGGTGLTTGPNGTVGGTTTFNSVNAVGGSPGIGATATNGSAGGAGGTGGTGTATLRLSGSPGMSGPGGTQTGANAGGAGGASGGGYGGGGAMPASATNGNPGIIYGGGGSGSGTFGGSGTSGGGGGGEFFELLIANPAATYTYTVGGGGAGGIGTGTGAETGGAGASGAIMVQCNFQ